MKLNWSQSLISKITYKDFVSDNGDWTCREWEKPTIKVINLKAHSDYQKNCPPESNRIVPLFEWVE